jgi:glycosyltransferase involved in cell wall biosynthesis
MKILLAVHGYPPELGGGTERHVRGLAKGLAGRGHDVTVLAGTLEWSESLRRSSRDVDGIRLVKIHRDDYRYERWERMYHPGVSRLVAELIEEVRPDVMHVHHWLRLTNDLVRQGAQRGVPVLLTMHDFIASCPTLHRVLPDDSWCNAPTDKAPCTSCIADDLIIRIRDGQVSSLLEMRRRDLANELQLASRVYALSHSQADRLRSVLGDDAPRIDTQPFVSNESMQRSPVPAAASPFRIMTLGQISKHKGQHVLLEALRRSQHRDRIELHIYGTSDSSEYSAALDTLSEGLRVIRHGSYEYEDLEQAPFHLAVLPSLSHESYGLVLDEVRMLGLPALVADRGAYPEHIENGGQAFRTGDAQDLAARIDRLIEDPAELDRMRQSVTAPETFNNCLRFVEAEYARASERGPTPNADRFDLLGHLELEHLHSDTCEREAHAWKKRAAESAGNA